MRNLKSALLLVTAVASLSLAAPAFANTLNLTLLNPTQAIAPGQTVNFDATVTAGIGNTGSIFLNSDSANVTDTDSAFTIDDSGFANFPFFLTASGPGSSFTGTLFTVTNTGMVNEAYSGVFSLFGGADGNANDLLATVTFGSPADTAAPEPSTLSVLATGLAAILFIGKKRLDRRPASIAPQ